MLAPNAVFFRFWPVWNSGTVLVEQCPRPPKVGYRSELTNIGRASNVSQQFGLRLWLLKRTKHENNHNGRPIDRRRMTTSVEGWGPRYKYRGVYLK